LITEHSAVQGKSITLKNIDDVHPSLRRDLKFFQSDQESPDVSFDSSQDRSKLWPKTSESAAMSDTQYRNHVLEKIRRGREDVLEGRLYTTEEGQR